MIKDPQQINKITDRPYCFEQYDEKNITCSEDCWFNEECENEKKVSEEYRDPKRLDQDNKPICFGDHFSPVSPVCKEKCADDTASECEISCETKINGSLNKPIASMPNIISAQQQKGIRSESLNVIYENRKPIEPPKFQSSNYVMDWARQAATTSYYSHKYNTQVGGDFFRPGTNLTNEQAEKYYGTPLHARPLVPGQFASETWYARLGKNVTLSTTDAIIRIICEQLSNIVRNIVWAPKN